MNASTKNDLSSGVAVFDLNALKKTAIYAVSGLEQEVRNELRALDNALNKNDVTSIHLTAQYLKDAASKLEMAADTYAVILGAENREKIVIKR